MNKQDTSNILSNGFIKCQPGKWVNVRYLEWIKISEYSDRNRNYYGIECLMHARDINFVEDDEIGANISYWVENVAFEEKEDAVKFLNKLMTTSH